MKDIDGLLEENTKLKESQGIGAITSMNSARERI